MSPDILEDVAYEADLCSASSTSTDKARQAVCLAALGNLLARRGDLEGAKRKLEEAILADPTSAIAQAALGALLLERRDGTDVAKSAFEKALQQDAGSVRALVGLGADPARRRGRRGQPPRFEAALRRRGDLAACVGLGNARLQQGKHAEAANAFQRAVALEPRSADALGGLGQALLGAGSLEEAERALRAASAPRRDQGTSIALGYTLARLKKSEEALLVFGQVLSLDANAAPALYGAGIASEDLGRADHALAFYRRVLAIPASGPQQPLVTELQKEARGRVAVLAAASAVPSAVAAASAGAREPVAFPEHAETDAMSAEDRAAHAVPAGLMLAPDVYSRDP